jgi:toluene monooxygenase electron transfer component
LDLVLRDRLEEAVRKGPGRLVLTVDQDAPGWTGEVGLLPEVVERWLPENWEEYEWYVAGPPPMVQAMRAFLERVGVSLDRVHYDSFG